MNHTINKIYPLKISHLSELQDHYQVRAVLKLLYALHTYDKFDLFSDIDLIKPSTSSIFDLQICNAPQKNSQSILITYLKQKLPILVELTKEK